MANAQNDQAKQQQDGRNEQQSVQPGNEQRSEGLLPAGDKDDGRFEVAEEVSLDQQSDAMRHVGQAPELPAGAKDQN